MTLLAKRARLREYDTATLDNAMAAIMTGTKKPNIKQQEYLERFVRRLKVEWLEKQQGNINNTHEEPLLDMIHGLNRADVPPIRSDNRKAN